MDMILAKKKRIVIDRKQNKHQQTKQGIWGMLSSVASLSSSSESKQQNAIYSKNSNCNNLFSPLQIF